MRNTSPTDFSIDVPGVGAFQFARRTLRDEMRIAAEYSRLTEGVSTPTDYLALVAGWLSVLTVLTVSAPDGWDLESMDPLDEETYAKLMQVHSALRDKEGSFRRKPNQAGAAAG
ncbi:MAG: hypothetical protein AB9M53_00970 [Leptothrix sp. (in: b-proteobacteria)]